MKKFVLPLATAFALGLSGAAMAGNVGPDHGTVAAQDHSIVATVSGPQLLTDSQMDQVVAGVQAQHAYFSDVGLNADSHLALGAILPCDAGNANSGPNGGLGGAGHSSSTIGAC